MPESNKLLVSFVISTYRQERTIRRAVQGALAQTYSPLEIVISDDCSPDRTWEIVKDEVSRYKGPHSVILNRNEKNLGAVENGRIVWSLTHGDYVVYSEGDDWSVPERTQKAMEAMSAHPSAYLVSSYVNKVDAEGNVTKCDLPLGGVEVIENNLYDFLRQNRLLSGATFTTKRGLGKHFGKMIPGRWSGDYNQVVRAVLLGPVVVVREPLVYYRTTGGVSTTRSKSIDESVRINVGRRKVYEQVLLDMECVDDLPRKEECSALVKAKIREHDWFIRALSGDGVGARIWAAVRYFNARDTIRRKLGVLLLAAVPKCLQQTLFAKLYSR